MDTQTLASFIAIVDAASITGAARRLGYSQSALSYQMKLLQREVGVPLLERRDRMIATRAGEEFYICSREVLHAVGECLQTIQSASLNNAWPTQSTDLSSADLHVRGSR